ncbi:MAG: hypothetical protein ACM3X0_10435 [Bacteroidota bacterium]
MTILFVTSHDEATQANHSMALRIEDNSDLRLYKHDAIRASLLNALQNQDDTTVFIMSHGRPVSVVDNMNSRAIDELDGPILSNYKIFAWACWTGATLGYKLAQSGTVWWGYDCPVTAPDERDPYASIMSNFFKTAKTLFVSANDYASVMQVLERIKNVCINAQYELDSIGADQDVDAFSIYSCCNQFWERLSVWLADHAVPCRHPLAPPAYIDI